VIGLKRERLRIRIAVAHRAHPEHFFHPIASSGLPLPIFFIFIFARRENQCSARESSLAIDCTQRPAIDKHEMQFLKNIILLCEP
jgi:hypothetical protein